MLEHPQFRLTCDRSRAMPPAPPPLSPAHAKLLQDGYQSQLRGQYDDAARAYRKILRAAPDQVDVAHLLGIVRARQGREQEAIGLYRQVVARKPADGKAWYNLALAHGALGEKAECVAAMERAYALDPAAPLAPNILLPARRNVWDWRDHAALLASVRRMALGEGPPVLPFLALYLDDPALHLAAARRTVEAEKMPARPLAFDHAARRTASGPIRVAYVSADYRMHPTTHLIHQLFRRHDRGRFEVTAISLGPDDGSRHRRDVEAAADRFLDRADAPPEAIAREVAELGIDVLVDLMGHTQGERLSLFAHRPAPVQVTYLGYPSTTGAPFMDYILADANVLPFADAALFSEKIVHLPDTYQPNDPAPPVAARPSRAEAGLPESGVVFCAFNTAPKLDPDTFSAHMRILSAVPGSVLWLLEGREGGADNLRREAAARGVDPARLVFAGIVPLEQHLARVALADLFLDTFPYTAHTTASDALRMGVPVVTRRGRSFASRVAASLLTLMDASDLVTETPAAFEAKAVALARDPAALAEVRARIAAARTGSPLYDLDRFTGHIERAFEAMTARFRAGLPPAPFAVDRLPSG